MNEPTLSGGKRRWRFVVAVLAAAALSPSAAQSIGFVQMYRARLSADNAKPVSGPALAWFQRAAWAPWSAGRAERGAALATALGGGSLEPLFRLGQAHSENQLLAWHVLRVAGDRGAPRVLLDAYDRLETQRRATFRDAAAAAAALLAVEEPGKGWLARSLSIWPDNLCALVAASSTGDEGRLAALSTEHYDGTCSDATMYRACLRRFVGAAQASLPDATLLTHQLALAAAVDASACPAPVGVAVGARQSVSAATLTVPSSETAELLDGQRAGLRLTGARVVEGLVVDTLGPDGLTRGWVRVRSAAGVGDRAFATRSVLKNGGFEAGGGVGPFTPWRFSRRGGPDGFGLVRESRTSSLAARFEAVVGPELVQVVAQVTAGHLYAVHGMLRAESVESSDRGLAIYAYPLSSTYHRLSSIRVQSGLSSPTWRRFTAFFAVPAGVSAFELALSSNAASAPIVVDDLVLIDVTALLGEVNR